MFCKELIRQRLCYRASHGAGGRKTANLLSLGINKIAMRGLFGGWREHGGLLTDKAVLPVTQIRLGDLNDLHEKGYTLGKPKCYGVA